jgi:cytochrome c-type biogenesis protein CcmH
MRAGIALTTILVAIACSQRVTPEEEYAERERERPLLAAGAETPAGGSMQPPGTPPGATGTAPAGASSDPAAIAVTLEWPAGPDQAVASTDVLFLFVRPPGVTSGPPLAVRRLPAPSFPLSIEIGPRDAMIPGTEFPERVAVSARLDRDGNAMTTGPDDWEATSEPVAAGGSTVLVLAPSGAR